MNKNSLPFNKPIRFCKQCSVCQCAKSRSRRPEISKDPVNLANTVRAHLSGKSGNVVKCPVCFTSIIVESVDQAIEYKRADPDMDEYVFPRLSFSSDNGYVSICHSCDTGEAEVKCIECNQKLCFDCVQTHLRTKATKRHHVTGIVDPDSTPTHSRSPSPVRINPRTRTPSPTRNGRGRSKSPIRNGRTRSPSPIRNGRSRTPSPKRNFHFNVVRKSVSPKRNDSTRSGSPKRSTGSDVPYGSYCTDSGVEDSLSPISPFESYSFTPNHVTFNTRLSHLTMEDAYQRGNSPRASERKQFDFKPVRNSFSSWKNDFNQITMFELPSYVLAMCSGSRDQCWISEAKSSAIHLYNVDGKHVKSVEIYNEVRDMVVNKATDELFVSCFPSKHIKVVNSVGEVETFATSSLHPAGISVNSHGDIIVCAVEDLRRRYKPEHKNCLQVYSKEGRLKREIERDVNGDKIFAYPEYIDVNINGDMIISDIEREHVVILNNDGKVRLVYKGPPKGTLDKPFDPRDVKCDKDGNIVVCDINNNSLHLLDINGAFIRLLLSEENGLYWPDVVAIDNRGHIWVRELWQHTVKIFKNV